MLQETTGYIICRTARKIHQFMTKALADYDITPEQWVVLQIVSKEKNLSQQDLSARLEKDKNSTKALVDRLIKKELLTRQKDDNDKRFYKLQATAAGVQLTKKLAELDYDFMQEAESGLTAEELASFTRILTRLEEKITAKL
ncbi:MAG: MarR family transcriptional regulator [Selenomonas sp.]|uniref:MarR family winged helix-turn-helix transcriptional regulator n=1 Tax=Selenomonas ruminantium TaxID=971 RepID=UPI001B0F1D79|nr:MarR family transcriptional regulator [Selenomonas ruminantium]MBO5650352.1 MarR family transcriptional regulator [Selenomonas sp.]